MCITKNRLFPVLLTTCFISACGGGGGGGDSAAELDNTPVTLSTDLPSNTSTTAPGNNTGNTGSIVPPNNTGSMVPTGVIATEEPVFNGTRPAVTDLYSQAQLDALEAIGFQFNFGDDPPSIEGSYLISMLSAQATSVPNDLVTPFTPFADREIRFFNQNNETLTIETISRDFGNIRDSNAQGTGSFISGSGNDFTVFLITENNRDGIINLTTDTYSGTIGAQGIENLQYAVFQLDDTGDPGGLLIPNDTGRLFIDNTVTGTTPRLPENQATIPLPSNGPVESSADSDTATDNPPADDVNILEPQDMENFEPLLGDVTFSVTPFAGGFFSSRFEFDANSLTTDANGNVVITESSPMGTVTCEFLQNDPSTYQCFIDSGMQQVAVLFSVFGSDGFGNGVVCLPASQDCSRDAVVFRLNGGPDGQASVVVLR